MNIFGPEEHGYFPVDDKSAQTLANEDMDVLFQGMNAADVKVTRLRAELSRPALAADLTLRASGDQSDVSPFLQTSNAIGQAPACPPPPDCGGDASSFGDGSENESSPSSGEGCAVRSSRRGESVFALGLLLAIGLGVGRRRRS
ncbi:MAG: hypothetical protein AAGA56_05150 [Myxococcota bacterium]